MYSNCYARRHPFRYWCNLVLNQEIVLLLSRRAVWDRLQLHRLWRKAMYDDRLWKQLLGIRSNEIRKR